MCKSHVLQELRPGSSYGRSDQRGSSKSETARKASELLLSATRRRKCDPVRWIGHSTRQAGIATPPTHIAEARSALTVAPRSAVAGIPLSGRPATSRCGRTAAELCTFVRSRDCQAGDVPLLLGIMPRSAAYLFDDSRP